MGQTVQDMTELESKNHRPGYARFSTDAQDITSQGALLKAAGCAAIFREKISGATAERPQLKKLMAKLEAGDVVTGVNCDNRFRMQKRLVS